MDYYQKKAHVEAIFRETAPPRGLLGYFRLIKELYAHNRNDLALTLCNAFVLSRRDGGRDKGVSSSPGDARCCGCPDTPSDTAALEAIHAALACSHAQRKDRVPILFAWARLCNRP